MIANRRKVLIPDNLGKEGVDVLAARGDIELVRYPLAVVSADLQAILGEAEAVVLSATRFGEAELNAAPRLRVVARIGVGYDAVAVDALTARRIPLMVTGTANSTSVAEQAVFFLLWLAKRGARMDALVHTGRWAERYAAMPVEITGKQVLVVGFGRIGTRFAASCRALAMQVTVYDPYVPAATIEAAGCAPAPDLDAALPRADFVSIHCPKTSETNGMFDAARLRRMRRGACLINTARGGIVDESALLAALTGGHLAGAGLDVFETEPAPPTNPLFELQQVITAPHMAGVTVESVAAMAEATAQNVLSALDGSPIRQNVVNVSVLNPA
jgi:D-3-phosphoglycerate dehydrogenase